MASGNCRRASRCGLSRATLSVNLAGGLCAGLLLGFLGTRGAADEGWHLFLGVGLLGGFTTFSAFSAETAAMLLRGQYGVAAAYMISSVVGALALLLAGLWLSRAAA